MLIEGLPPTCETLVALGADPWTVEQHMLRDIANSNRSLDAVLFNVHRDRDKTEPRTVDPIPAPKRVLTPEQQAAAEAREIEERKQREIDEHAGMITHDIGMGLFRGEVTMLELSRRIKAAGGLN